MYLPLVYRLSRWYSRRLPGQEGAQAYRETHRRWHAAAVLQITCPIG